MPKTEKSKKIVFDLHHSLVQWETVSPFQLSTNPHADDIIIVIGPTGLDVMLVIINTQAFSPLIGHNENNQHGVDRISTLVTLME